MYLLDTPALVWAIVSPSELPKRVRHIIASGEVKASVVSHWELVLKKERALARALVDASIVKVFDLPDTTPPIRYC